MVADPHPILTGRQLREAASRQGMTQREVAKAAGVAIRTVSALFNHDGPITQARPTTLDHVARALNLETTGAIVPVDPHLTIELPIERLQAARQLLPALAVLREIAAETRDKQVLLDRLAPLALDRMTSASLRDNDLYFDWIGKGIRWAGSHVRNKRVLDLPDLAVARAAAERYWKALITGDPVCQFVRTSDRLEFVALTVPTGDGGPRGLVTVTQLGRPQL